MVNPYYTPTGTPATGAAGESAPIRAELTALQVGFDKLPVWASNALKIVRVNVTETGLEAVAAIGLTSLIIATGTITASLEALAVTQTWNNGGVTFVAKDTNITNTASAAGSLLERWRVGAVMKAQIDRDGKIESAVLTNTRVPYYGTGLIDSANLTFSGTVLTAHTITCSTGTLTGAVSVTTPIVTSGAASDLTFSTSGGTQVVIEHIGAAINYLVMRGTASGAPHIRVAGTDADIGLLLTTKGTGSITLATATPAVNQVLITHTASATRTLNLTGSNGGNPTISTSAGNLAITPAIIGAATNGNALGGIATSTSTVLNLAVSTTGISSLRMGHGTAPSAPVDGDFWTTTGGAFVRINGGTQQFTVAMQTLTDGATITWDTALGNLAKVTLGGNRTMAAPTNAGDSNYVLHVIQGGGGNTLAWNAVFKWPLGVIPVLSTGAGARDVFSFTKDGSNWYGSILKGMA